MPSSCQRMEQRAKNPIMDDKLCAFQDRRAVKCRSHSVERNRVRNKNQDIETEIAHCDIFKMTHHVIY